MSDTYSALKTYRERIVAMLEDPECADELLSLGIALLDFAVLRSTRGEKKFEFYASRVWGSTYRGSKTRSVLRRDIRRYDALKDADTVSVARLCGAPMVRRQGPCNQSAGLRTMLTDVDTGRRQWIAACSRHRDWFEDRVRANRLVVESSDVVVSPPANAGGVLARHIPEIDWGAVWVGLDPKWTAPPEVDPVEVPLKPRLRLVLGGIA